MLWVAPHPSNVQYYKTSLNNKYEKSGFKSISLKQKCATLEFLKYTYPSVI